MKKPWVAAFLNLIFFGGGYLYNGRQKQLGAGLLIGCIVVRFGKIPIYLTHNVFDQWLVLFIGLVIMQFTLAIDAFKESKRINASTR